MSAVLRLGAAALRALPPERAHKLAIAALASPVVARVLPSPRRFANLRLETPLSAKPLPTPIALAAGFDKHGQAVTGCAALGFGAVEIGSVTPRPQPGNAAPRVFRLSADQAVINRYGFNSHGADIVAERLAGMRRRLDVPLGINLGKNKNGGLIADYAAGLDRLAPLADYVTLNLSSPNTPGLRDAQNLDAITALIDALGPHWPAAAPVLVKLAPDLADDDLAALVDHLATTRVAGVIMGNTTLSRPASLVSAHAHQAGGLSGAPLYPLALAKLAVLARANRALPANRRLMLVGCGGVSTALQALEMIRAGASVVQLYSALTTQDAGLVGRLNAQLSALVDQAGAAGVGELVGGAR